MSQDRSKLRWNGWGWVAHKDELAQRGEVWAWLASELGMPALLATPPRPLEELSLPPNTLSSQDRLALTAIVGAGQLRDGLEELPVHARGRSYRDLLHLRTGDLSDASDAVLYPRSTDEVLAILALAAERRITVIPCGGGTSLRGGVAAIRGECTSIITLDLSDMDRVIAIDPVSHSAEVEAGIYGPALETALKAKGLTLGHAPPCFEFSTLGGWIAADGATPFAPPQDWLAGVKLATPTGLIDTALGGGGPDMTTLVGASEGQFGIITEATIRLKPLAPESRYHAYLFADFPTGLAALRTLRQDGCGAVVLRLCDAEETRVSRSFEQLGKRRGRLERLGERVGKWRGLAAEPCRMVAGFEGDAHTVAFQKRRLEAIARRYRATALGRADGEASRPWRAPYIRDSLLERGVGALVFEAAASWFKLQTVYETTRAALDAVLRETAPRDGAHGMVLCHMRQATPGGATLAFTAIFPRAIGADLEQADTIETAALQAILSSGGTPHHGFAPATRARLWRAKGDGAVAALRALKQSLDPQNVLALGRLVP